MRLFSKKPKDNAPKCWGDLKPGECAKGPTGTVWMRIAVGCRSASLSVLADEECSSEGGESIAMTAICGKAGWKDGQTVIQPAQEAFSAYLPNACLIEDDTDDE